MGYATPTTISDAVRLMAKGDVRLVAGGTDFFPLLGEGKPPSELLDVSGLPELRGVTRGPRGWKIGAATTWSDIIRADLPPAFDGLKAAAREVGSIQIQNAGTVAGNLCNASPAADGVPPLLTLDAVVEIHALDGTRMVPLGDFITGVRRIDLAPHELVVAIHVPALPDGTTGHFLKLGSRRYLVISIAMASAIVSLDGDGRITMARVAVGACSPVAQRLHRLEATLISLNARQVMTGTDIWSSHLAGLSPIGDVRGSADYRLDVVAELCRRVVLGAMGHTGEGV